MSMKKKSRLIWCAFAVCLIGMIILRIVMELQNVKYQEVQATVVSAETKHIRKWRSSDTYDIYEVRVTYKGKVHELGNAFKSYQYSPGQKVKAYLSNGRLYANLDGVKTSTPVAKCYFACLYGSFIFVILGLVYMEKAKREERESIEKNETGC